MKYNHLDTMKCTNLECEICKKKKIVLFDPNCYKFTNEMQEHWESQGHEFKKSLYYDPALADWADVIWFETCDNNLRQATTNEDFGWKLSSMTGKHVICRCIDIEVWCGLHNQVDWSMVDDVIFLAPHIKNEVEKTVNLNGKTHIIPCGVSLEKFRLSTQPQNKNIAWVAERWFAKGIDLFLQYAAMLYKIDPEYKIFSVGIWADNSRDGWYRAYIDQFIRENPMNVEFIDRVDNMNDFLQNMTYTICFSKKEAFSYATAEGMSVGCKPIVHNFYGSSDIWNKDFIFNTVDEAIEMTTENLLPREFYRRWIERNYSIDKMLKSFDNIINKKGV